LTQYGGTRDPLFKRAIIQSPGFSISTFDRRGLNEKTYKDFVRLAGCADEPNHLACLRKKETKILKDAQDKVIDLAPEGTFGFGPSADGAFVRQMPQLELASGNHCKSLESVVVTHVSDEGSMFVAPDAAFDDKAYAEYVDWEYGNKTEVTRALLKKFNLKKYPTPRDRLVAYTTQSAFTCTTRMIAKAYKDRFWAAEYEGLHGSGEFILRLFISY
jgi:carboxylesterase type B